MDYMQVRSKKKAKAPVCDGRCLRAKKCTKCLKKRAIQAVERTARQQKRYSKRTEDARVAHAPRHEAKAEATQTSTASMTTTKKPSTLDEWAPGRLRATPERLAFTPTPPSSVRK